MGIYPPYNVNIKVRFNGAPHPMHKKSLVVLLIVLTITSLGGSFAYTASAQDDDRTGETILLQGQVTDSDGNPIADAVVELWQADINGNYNHPNDAAASDLLPNFQYMGTVTTDAEGYYAFLTVKPAQYEARPPHLHFKVKIDSQTLLISQWYFEEDRETVEGDGAFGNAGDTLFLLTEDTTDADGNPLRIGTGNIVLDLNGDAADALPVTAAQTEGPYYPVIDFSEYDNNLVSVAEDDELVTPILEDTEVVEFTLLNLNTASSDDFLTIPGVGNRMVREFEEYRPYISIQQFRREIGKYVDDATVAGYEAYVYVPIDVNESDAATLMQIPGVDETAADALIAARPFDSNEAFLAALGDLVPEANPALAAYYLVTE